MAKYKYDAWGNCEIDASTTDNELANLNPFRYRSYYYDPETNLYFLKTRYYDPEIGRFMTIDDLSYIDPESINGLNLYAYCGNNPVMYYDPNGHALLSILMGLGIAMLIGATVGGVSYVAGTVLSYVTTGNWSWSWGEFVGSIVGGAIAGGISFLLGKVLPFKLIVSFLEGVISTSLKMIGSNVTGDTNHSLTEILSGSIDGGVQSVLSLAIMKKIKINGLNAGRGSYAAVNDQINKKFYNGRIRRITLKTFDKMWKVNMYEGVAEIFFGAVVP